MGESSKEGEKRGGCGGGGAGLGVGGLVCAKTKVEVPGGGGGVVVAGLGAIRRGRDDGCADEEGRGDGEGVQNCVFRTGIVSARSTMVLKLSRNGSQAISVVAPAPEPLMMRIVMALIFSRVLPA